MTLILNIIIPNKEHYAIWNLKFWNQRNTDSLPRFDRCLAYVLVISQDIINNICLKFKKDRQFFKYILCHLTLLCVSYIKMFVNVIIEPISSYHLFHLHGSCVKKKLTESKKDGNKSDEIQFYVRKKKSCDFIILLFLFLTSPECKILSGCGYLVFLN